MQNNVKKGELLSIAIHIATNAHHGQFDRGGNPYILHPFAVMNIVQNIYGNDEELLCICLLHDVVEDCKDITFKSLEEKGMTERIISALRCVTKMPGESYEEYQNKIYSNIDAMKVKKGDLIHNSDIKRLKGVRPKDIERITKYHNFYLEIEKRLFENGIS